jgi:uncharacterized membrane protein
MIISAQSNTDPPIGSDVPEMEAAGEAADLVAQTVSTIAALHVQAEQRVGRHQRLIETLTRQLGRPRFYYFVLAFVLLWMGTNLAARFFGRMPWDAPPFFWLQGLVGLSALLMTIIVLITQNRQGQTAERRAQLNLQINLLSEQKVTKLISLVEELRRDLPSVQNRDDPEAEAMTEAADPAAVLSALEESLEEAVAEASLSTDRPERAASDF